MRITLPPGLNVDGLPREALVQQVGEGDAAPPETGPYRKTYPGFPKVLTSGIVLPSYRVPDYGVKDIPQ